jgi:lincosamide nucleotidyltransferase B/F
MESRANPWSGFLDAASSFCAMSRTELLLNRLDEIGKSLARRESALALIGLGSIGVEVDRLDAFSDLDFFVIVKPESKPSYLEDLSWLTEIAPFAYYFANTEAGYEFLYEDGVFCEFAVFEDHELMKASFAPGRIVWKAEGVDDAISIPKHPPIRPAPQPTEKLIGEALTNLYIGLLAISAAKSFQLCASSRGTLLTVFSNYPKKSRRLQ